MTGYVLTESADADLQGIIRYTQGRWGAGQARSYVAKLVRGMERLAAGDAPIKDLTGLNAHLRMTRCERHYIFCLPREGAPHVIVAVLHERMDMMARLTIRLAEAGSGPTQEGDAS